LLNLKQLPYYGKINNPSNHIFAQQSLQNSEAPEPQAKKFTKLGGKSPHHTAG
jgi:hypothetical protein